MKSETLLVSATQLSMVDETQDGGCDVKWALAYIAGFKSPQTASQALGTEVDDKTIQPYLRFGTPFDLKKRAGRIAQSAIDILPPPKDSRVKVQHCFVTPSLSSKAGEPAPFAFLGYKDIYIPGGGLLGYTDNNPVVGDTKTTKSFDWMKTGDKLRNDPQAVLYAFNALYEAHKRGEKRDVVHLNWIYLRTTEPFKSLPSLATVDKDHVLERMKTIDAFGHKILGLWEGSKGCTNDEERKAYALSLKPNLKACGSFGGCHYRSFCNHAPDEFNGGDAFSDDKRRLPIMSDTIDLFGMLEEQVTNEDAVLGINPPKTQAAPRPKKEEPKSTATLLPKEPDVVPPAASEEGKRKRRTKAEMEAARAAEKAAMEKLPTVPGIGEGDEGEEEPSVQITPNASGTSFSVTWGRESYSFEPGNGYENGPFSVTVQLREGDSLVAAMMETHNSLRTFAAMARADKAAAYKGGK